MTSLTGRLLTANTLIILEFPMRRMRTDNNPKALSYSTNTLALVSILASLRELSGWWRETAYSLLFTLVPTDSTGGQRASATFTRLRLMGGEAINALRIEMG